MRAKLASVSVDLDEVPEYLAIHGLPPFPSDAKAKHAVYDSALHRILGWATALSIPITFFAIGKDLSREKNREALKSVVANGHTVENHSFSHFYDLSRLPRDLIENEVVRGMQVIGDATGVTPQGFRAPGYTVSETLLDVLDEAHVSFDSSVFPSPVYWGAKAAVLGWMRLIGRESVSILGGPDVLMAPRGPYRPAQPYYRRANGRIHRKRRSFIELPIMTAPWIGFPVIGTSIGKVGPSGAMVLGELCAQGDFINLELHGMDFLEGADVLEGFGDAPENEGGDAPESKGYALMGRGLNANAAALCRKQPELQTPLFSRVNSLDRFIETVRLRGFEFVTLGEAARHYASRM